MKKYLLALLISVSCFADVADINVRPAKKQECMHVAVTDDPFFVIETINFPEDKVFTIEYKTLLGQMIPCGKFVLTKNKELRPQGLKSIIDPIIWSTNAFNKGEEVEIIITSEDFYFSKKIIPLPYEKKLADGKILTLCLKDPLGMVYSYTLSGFTAGETITVENTPSDKTLSENHTFDESGTYTGTINHSFVGGIKGGKNTLLIHVKDQHYSCDLFWGDQINNLKAN